MKVISIPPDSLPTRRDKLAGLDVVRAGAVLGVVLLHCCVPYMQPAAPGLAWAVRDTPHWIPTQCFWTLELFIMPLFLFIAGLLAWQTLEHGGAMNLVQNRARRLLIPLLFGIVVILPLDLYVWLIGWVSDGVIEPRKLRSLKFDAGVDADLWGLSHLWFLQYLFTYVVALAAWSWVRQRFPSMRRFVPSTGMAMVLCLSIGCLTLYRHPEVVWGFQHDFWPVPSKWLYSGVFFALGVLMASRGGNSVFMNLKPHAGQLAGAAIAVGVAALAVGNWHLRGGSNQYASVILAVTTCLSAYLMVLAIVVSAVRGVTRVPRAIEYLAAASFWIYLMHHPLLGLIQIDLKWLFPSFSATGKVVVAFLLTTALSLAVYESAVRTTVLGRWLGFQWEPTRPTESIREAAQDPAILSLERERESRVRSTTTAPSRRAA
jgi:peptidoglycan/LPS O-acetylase OafA/YrhL